MGERQACQSLVRTVSSMPAIPTSGLGLSKGMIPNVGIILTYHVCPPVSGASPYGYQTLGWQVMTHLFHCLDTEVHVRRTLPDGRFLSARWIG